MLTVRPVGDYFVVGLCVEDILDRFGVYFGQCNLFFDFVDRGIKERARYACAWGAMSMTHMCVGDMWDVCGCGHLSCAGL